MNLLDIIISKAGGGYQLILGLLSISTIIMVLIWGLYTLLGDKDGFNYARNNKLLLFISCLMLIISFSYGSLIR